MDEGKPIITRVLDARIASCESSLINFPPIEKWPQRNEVWTPQAASEIAVVLSLPQRRRTSPSLDSSLYIQANGAVFFVNRRNAHPPHPPLVRIYNCFIKSIAVLKDERAMFRMMMITDLSTSPLPFVHPFRRAAGARMPPRRNAPINRCVKQRRVALRSWLIRK